MILGKDNFLKASAKIKTGYTYKHGKEPIGSPWQLRGCFPNSGDTETKSRLLGLNFENKP
ncbi:hypothetical protein V1478_014924 [Vespula squamosa]|uniref:Uncharacterized protein n=1 Tax=Vespula squamosa TaxID=30214 RepID=A0ABD2A3P4_VESSQ